MDYSKLKENTKTRLSEGIQEGDIFTERLHHYELVLGERNGKIDVIGTDGFEIKSYTQEEYKEHASYDNIEGYWMVFLANDDIYIYSFLRAYYDYISSQKNEKSKDRDKNLSSIIFDGYPRISKIYEEMVRILESKIEEEVTE